MTLLELRNISLSFSHPPLLDSISISIEKGERICLIGRNGEGKTTLLKIISGEICPDSGERLILNNSYFTYLQQDLPKEIKGSVFDIVADGLGKIINLIKDYDEISKELEQKETKTKINKLIKIQDEIDSINGWELKHQVNEILSRMKLNPNNDFSLLSGGMKRRALLARALVKNPDLLILDEPTNHLDVETIHWLEDYLLNWGGAIIFITHDRNFLKKLSTRIVELDRGTLTNYPCDYDEYLSRRSNLENSEALSQNRFDKKLLKEEAWIRRGVKARRARNEGRVRKLDAMRKRAAERRRHQGLAKLKISVAERSGNLICEIKDAYFSWGSKKILENFSISIQSGEKIGIVGSNGCGKTTLINLILGNIKPDKGKITTGTKLKVAYFDQLRGNLRLEDTVIDNVSDGSSHVDINGKNRHIIGYLGDFLFPPAKCLQPVKALSGGEKNRLVLAKIFTQPANIFILDEPTNDLDLETLELLEELLIDFPGTLFLVSHDREFLDNVVTSLIIFDQDGSVSESVGGYKDWQLKRKNSYSQEKKAPKKHKVSESRLKSSKLTKKKLSYKDQLELNELPSLIENLELEQKRIQKIFLSQDLYSKEDPIQLKEYSDKLKEIEKKLEICFERWENLE